MPSSSVEETTFSKTAIGAVLSQERIGVDLHCHFEGILSLEDLQSISQELGEASTFRPETWAGIGTIMNGNNEHSFRSFSERLTGRWIRLMLIKACLHGSHSFDTTVPLFITAALEKMYEKGIGILELMVSVMTLCNEGDFLLVPEREDALPEERELTGEWNTNIAEWISKGTVNVHTLSKRHLLELFQTVLMNDKKYVLSGAPLSGNKMSVGIKLMIRREKDLQFLNTNPHVGEEAERIRELYQNNLLVGIDIAGDESVQWGKLEHFSQFLTLLKDMQIPYTAHAGELPGPLDQYRELANDNFRSVLRYAIPRIGHATRLFDEVLSSESLMEKVIRSNTFIELNISSNMETGIVKHIQEHPILAALRGEHKSLRSGSELFDKLWKLVIVCDDDPIIVSEDNSLLQELSLTAYHTSGMGFPTPYDFLKHQYQIGERAKLKYFAV